MSRSICLFAAVAAWVAMVFPAAAQDSPTETRTN